MKIISHEVTPFNRLGVAIKESLWLNGEPFFTQKAIGNWLGYTQGNPSILKIIKRHPFIETHSKQVEVLTEEVKKVSTVSKLDTVVKGQYSSQKRRRPRKIRVFSLIGTQLIAMKATTPNAEKYQEAIARLGEAFMHGKLVPRSAIEQQAEKILESCINVSVHERKFKIDEYKNITGLSRSTAHRHLTIYKNGESPFDKKWRNAVKPVISGDLELKIREIFFSNPGIGSKAIRRLIDEKERPSLCVMKSFLRKLKQERDQAEGIVKVEKSIKCPDCGRWIQVLVDPGKSVEKMKQIQKLKGKVKSMAVKLQRILEEIQEVE